MFWYCLRGIGKQTMHRRSRRAEWWQCGQGIESTGWYSMNSVNEGAKEIYMHLLLSFCVRYILDRLVRPFRFECMHNILRMINLCIRQWDVRVCVYECHIIWRCMEKCNTNQSKKCALVFSIIIFKSKLIRSSEQSSIEAWLARWKVHVMYYVAFQQLIE